jgi:hypothetical protein
MDCCDSVMAAPLKNGALTLLPPKECFSLKRPAFAKTSISSVVRTATNPSVSCSQAHRTKKKKKKKGEKKKEKKSKRKSEKGKIRKCNTEEKGNAKKRRNEKGRRNESSVHYILVAQLALLLHRLSLLDFIVIIIYFVLVCSTGRTEDVVFLLVRRLDSLESRENMWVFFAGAEAPVAAAAGASGGAGPATNRPFTMTPASTAVNTTP